MQSSQSGPAGPATTGRRGFLPEPVKRDFKDFDMAAK
jgi:hypothetical protein